MALNVNDIEKSIGEDEEGEGKKHPFIFSFLVGSSQYESGIEGGTKSCSLLSEKSE